MQEALEMTDEEMDRAAHRILMQERVEGVRILSFADLQKALEVDSGVVEENLEMPEPIEDEVEMDQPAAKDVEVATGAEDETDDPDEEDAETFPWKISSWYRPLFLHKLV